MTDRKEAGLEDAHYLRGCILSFLLLLGFSPHKSKDTSIAVSACVLRRGNI